MPQTILTARSLGRRSQQGDWLLRGISLKLHKGERVALVGPSGSGKTLMLRALAMLDPLDSGELLWNGRRVAGDRVPEFRSQVIYLHQRPVIGDGTVEQILRAPLSFQQHMGREFMLERHGGWLGVLERGVNFLEKRASTLSGGEAQIVALLRAVQLDPAVLLLDEPTAALDAEAAQSIERLVQVWLDEAAEARATVWVSHDAQQANRVANVHWEMHDGELRQEAVA